jgi:two-component system, OmpR family, KDP operon response regulator KdpE
VGELLARIRAALRRSSSIHGEASGSPLRFGQVEVDLERRVVKSAGAEIHLTPNEYKLLQVFVKYPGKVLTQRQLLSEVWGPNQTEQAQYLRVYIAQLRRKLEADPARPKLIQTEPGVGYRLMVE